MKKGLILAGLVLAGALAGSRGAVAQTNTYGFDLVGTGGGATGTWHVVLQKYMSTAADLPGKQFRIHSIERNGAPNQPNANGINVALSLFGKVNGSGPYLSFGSVIGLAGLSTGGVQPNVTGTNPWLTTLSNLNGPGVKKVNWKTQNVANANFQLHKSSLNTFLQQTVGRVQTKLPHGAASAYITVTGVGGQTWGALVAVSTHNAPEASSLALLLPGLVPLGIVLRKRSRSRAASAS